MKAVVYKGTDRVAIENIEDPRIESPNDAIVRITSTAICGSDLHMYNGRTAAQPGLVFGHEPLGVIEEVGKGVVAFKKGDRVVMPFNIACGFCYNCVRGYPNACLTVNPHAAGGAYGYVNMGPYRGGQAEYLRVPFADFNCLKLPGQPHDQWEDDFVLLADIFATAYHATELAMVQTGSTVAIFGAGPVGMLAAYCSILRGASEVFVVDYTPERLKKAEAIGAIPVDFSKGDPVEQILALRRSNKAVQESLVTGAEKMPGVLCGIDAVGYRAMDWEHPGTDQPNRVLSDLVRLVNPTGHIGVIGDYLPMDPGGKDRQAKFGEFPLWFGKLWEKGLTIGTGQTPVKKYDVYLRDLIISGRAKPSFIISHDLPLTEAPDAYQKFDQHATGYTKVILKPALAS